MPEKQFQLVVTLRKGVDTPEEAEFIYNLVKQKMSDRPDVIVKGHVTNHYDQPE